MGFSRSGIPADVQPWHADWAPSGNGFEIDLVPDYKILHDAGYNVLAYDLRNHGLSSAANGGVTTHGNTESRDVVGSLEYARTRPDTRDMVIGLFSRCMGGVSTFAAMTRFPEVFEGVRCLVSPQPVTRVPQEWAKNVRVPTFLTRFAATASPTRVTSRRCTTTFQWPRRSCSGSTAPGPGSTVTWSSSAARSPCSTGSRSTCPDLASSAVVRTG
jgi:pimeloyl-ACP methyl ester carboxylesterase